MHHSRTNGKHDLKVQETLTELIDNNKIILESRIKNDAIYHFINERFKLGSNLPPHRQEHCAAHMQWLLGRLAAQSNRQTAWSECVQNSGNQT